MIGCPVAAACLDPCWLGELSQHPMCPHSAHRRRCSHQPPDSRHSTQPVPLGGTAESIEFVMFAPPALYLSTLRRSRRSSTALRDVREPHPMGRSAECTIEVVRGADQ